jgi:hypothetical protein
MATRDMASGKKVVQHLSAAAYTTTQTPTNGVDTQGFDALTFAISIGVVSNIANSPQPSWTFKAQESDTQNASFTDITDSDRILVAGAKSPAGAPDSSTGVFLTVDAAAEDDTVYHVGVVSAKRYVRVVSTAAATPGSTPISIVALLEKAGLTPVAN